MLHWVCDIKLNSRTSSKFPSRNLQVFLVQKLRYCKEPGNEIENDNFASLTTSPSVV